MYSTAPPVCRIRKGNRYVRHGSAIPGSRQRRTTAENGRRTSASARASHRRPRSDPRLVEYPEGEARNQYAVEALKIGILALRHVGGQVERRLSSAAKATASSAACRKRSTSTSKPSRTNIEDKLKEYFDPKDGRFTDRVQRLVAHDGELSQLIKGFIDGENSLFARTLVTHVGRDSALMKLLDPQQSDGLLTTLRKTVDDQLTHQRDHVLKEFSLDNKEGALSRLVSELTTNHGDLGKDCKPKSTRSSKSSR